MSRKRVEFELHVTRPGGVWGDAAPGPFLRVQQVDEARCRELGITEEGDARWRYAWSDGWAVTISARVMGKGERKRKSKGFMAYEWMVDNILHHGSPYGPEGLTPVTPEADDG